ncbi:hypothetical protein NDU88_009644 [Pleurodeles waltl]|uniref:Uncharacterized protein n=1 Tax=Pleurodeles waltl TaxID=8319 RepID=A0AAV7S0Z0_PLEWA|nr:hypothetical protein NDU88_009644 [Pleurodeles waltl]
MTGRPWRAGAQTTEGQKFPTRGAPNKIGKGRPDWLRWSFKHSEEPQGASRARGRVCLGSVPDMAQEKASCMGRRADDVWQWIDSQASPGKGLLTEDPLLQRLKRAQYSRTHKLKAPSKKEVQKDGQRAMKAVATLSGSDPGSHWMADEDLEHSGSDQDSDASHISAGSRSEVTLGCHAASSELHSTGLICKVQCQYKMTIKNHMKAIISPEVADNKPRDGSTSRRGTKPKHTLKLIRQGGRREAMLQTAL